MDVPFNKVIVDSRHAAAGTSTTFDISLPETLVLPPNACVYTTDVVISNTMPSLGSGSWSFRHIFYFLERYNGLTFLNRTYLDETKLYHGISFAAELQLKMNAVSVVPDASTTAGYKVNYELDMGVMKFEAADNGWGFVIVNDNLLGDPDFQAAFETKTGLAQTPWVMDWRNQQSAMRYIGLGKASTVNILWPDLQTVLNQVGLYPEQFSGAIDVRKCHCIYLHSSNITNYKCLGPAGSRSILAKIPVNQGHGGVLVHQHSGHVLDYTPCGGITTQTLTFDLRSGDNEPIDLRGGFVSFTLRFAMAPVH